MEIENENKRPIVYVARKLTYFNENNIECTAGYYVSKAYLNFAGKWYEKDGTIKKEFAVDFVNRFEQLDAKGEYEFYAEISDSNKSKTEVFKRYIDCKIYVDEQNKQALSTEIGTTSVAKVQKRMEVYKQVCRYAEKLEKKYISLEEREQISEDVKSY